MARREFDTLWIVALTTAVIGRKRFPLATTWPARTSRTLLRPLARWEIPARHDPRWPFAALLALYAALGCTLLGFNRSPTQIFTTVAACCVLDLLLAWLARTGSEWRPRLPLSAAITGLSLALLLNYAHGSPLLFVPVYLAIGSKYVFTYRGKHVYNPSLFGVTVSLLLMGDLISPAPAYQWGGMPGGTLALSFFLAMAALSLFVFRVGRVPLIVSFLLFYALQTALRAYLMRWHLPPETLFVGTLTSAPFFLFTFYMLTDPATSPPRPRDQVLTALAIALIDLLLHRLESLYTFYYAAFFVTTVRFLWLHLRDVRQRRNHLSPVLEAASYRPLVVEGPTIGEQSGLTPQPPSLQGKGETTAAVSSAARRSLPSPRRRGAGGEAPEASRLLPVGIVAVGVAGGLLLNGAGLPLAATPDPGFRLAAVPLAHSGLTSQLGNTLEEVDPRLRHVAKWILSVGDSVAVGDWDGDGQLDLFTAQPLKRPEDRAILYRGLGDFRFQRVPLPCLDAVTRDPARYGLISGALFVDYDNDGDQDLFLPVGFGPSRLLRNTLAETGHSTFADATQEVGLGVYTVSVAAQWFDWDRDGRLDLLLANALSPTLRDYPRPTPLNPFYLPQPEYPGDRRMLHFMHESWYRAFNGGLNLLYRNEGKGRLQPLDSAAWGMPETGWSLAIGTGDLNDDGWTDLYIANDFGPDDCYLNVDGQRFQAVRSALQGGIGRDTYKGMNASVGDVDRDGHPEIYVSNVHEPLQAEGSLLWTVHPRPGRFTPEFQDQATSFGALNERRFGWGAAMGDLNNDGWPDLLQANGMVDDTPDRRYPGCPSYWYVNEKIMRAGPEIHGYADMWGDLRGRCIFGREANRVYLNRGAAAQPRFVDVASQVGWTERTNSRGMALADFNNDGLPDVVVTHPFAPPSLYRNVAAPGPPNHWLGLQLIGDGRHVSREAIGTRVWIIPDDPAVARNFRPLMGEVRLANGFSAQDDRRLRFGLGSYSGTVTARVAWYGGPTMEYPHLRLDRYHEFVLAKQPPASPNSARRNAH